MSEFVDFLIIFHFLKQCSLLLLKLVFIRFRQVCSDLCSSLLSRNFLLFFPFKIFFDLSLDKFAFKQLLLNLFDIIQFELFKLVTDILGVFLPEVIFLLKLSFHLLVILGHLLPLNFLPMLFNLAVNLFLPVPHSFLCLLLISDVAHEHLGFQGLDHVLTFMHMQVRLLKSLSTQFILIVLLNGINSSALNLIKFKWTTC